MFMSGKEESSKESADSEDSDELIRRLQSSMKMKPRNGKSRSAGCQQQAGPPSSRKLAGRPLDRSFASFAETYSRTTSAASTTTSHSSTSTGSVLLSPEKRLFSGSVSSGGGGGGGNKKQLLPPLQILNLEECDALPGAVQWRPPRVASPSIPVPVTRSSVERQHNDFITESEVEVQRIKCQCFLSRLQSRSCGTQTDPRPPPETLRNPWFVGGGKGEDEDVVMVTGEEDGDEGLQGGDRAADSDTALHRQDLTVAADKSDVTQGRRKRGCLAMLRRCCSFSR